MTESLPGTAVVRVSTGRFDPNRYAEVEAADVRTSKFLIPAIKQLPGLVQYHAGIWPEGSLVNVSVWDSARHADQMGELKEMTVLARGEMLAVGVTFQPIVNYPVRWTIPTGVAGESLPATAALRVSRGSFDPSRYDEVDAMNTKSSEYLIPAVQQLPGLIHFYACVSPEGSVIHVSVWDTVEHAAQLDNLKEMAVIARGEAEAVGVAFHPIINYPIDWSI